MKPYAIAIGTLVVVVAAVVAAETVTVEGTKHTCRLCKGRGTRDLKCPACIGKGKLVLTDMNAPRKHKTYGTVDCPGCNGSGVLRKAAPCPDCRGKGHDLLINGRKHIASAANAQQRWALLRRRISVSKQLAHHRAGALSREKELARIDADLAKLAGTPAPTRKPRTRKPSPAKARPKSPDDYSKLPKVGE